MAHIRLIMTLPSPKLTIPELLKDGLASICVHHFASLGLSLRRSSSSPTMLSLARVQVYRQSARLYKSPQTNSVLVSLSSSWSSTGHILDRATLWVFSGSSNISSLFLKALIFLSKSEEHSGFVSFIFSSLSRPPFILFFIIININLFFDASVENVRGSMRHS